MFAAEKRTVISLPYWEKKNKTTLVKVIQLCVCVCECMYVSVCLCMHIHILD